MDNLLFIKNNITYKSLGVADELPFKEMDAKKKKHLKEGAEKLHLGKDYLSATRGYDVIIKSPGIPVHSLDLKKGQVLTSQSDIFLQNCRGKVLGITGTKGKSTTSVLAHNLLLNAGFSSHLIGNIGTPALSKLQTENDKDVFVYELSSFQLATIKKSPHIAVILNIFTDHLDKHKDFEDYISSKEKITAFQTKKDFLIYNQENEIVKEIAERSSAKKIPFSPFGEREDLPISPEPLHEIGKLFDIGKEDMKKTFSEFRGLPHRREYLGRYKGIDFYNDSAATIPEATIHAIDNLKDVQTLILGGSDKGANLYDLIERIKESEIQNIIIFKGSPEILREKLENSDKIVFTVSNMKEAVQHSFNNTDNYKKCLLSPGFASFNMFRNYKERGELFKEYVRNS